MTFRVEQKVVCVGGNGTSKPPGFWKAWAREWGLALPQRGTIYTVRDTRIAADGSQRVRLCEIVNPVIEFTDAPDQEPWFWASHFRPIVERKTDISFALAILRKAKAPARALALTSTQEKTP
jgi:hypothetical protein